MTPNKYRCEERKVKTLKAPGIYGARSYNFCSLNLPISKGKIYQNILEVLFLEPGHASRHAGPICAYGHNERRLKTFRNVNQSKTYVFASFRAIGKPCSINIGGHS